MTIRKQPLFWVKEDVRSISLSPLTLKETTTMDYYINRMLTDLPTSTELSAVEVPSDIAAGFVGSTGYIDGISPDDFVSRAADVLYGKDQHGRTFISMRVLRTSALSAGTVLALARGEALSKEAREELAWAAKPRVLTLFQRYQDRDDLFVTAGDVTLGAPKECPAEFNDILHGWGGRYQFLTQKDLGVPTTPVAVPEHAVRAVDGYHIDGTVGVVNL